MYKITYWDNSNQSQEYSNENLEVCVNHLMSQLSTYQDLENASPMVYKQSGEEWNSAFDDATDAETITNAFNTVL